MSGGAPIPYIGSRISLISVSGIRYEGILFSIDPKQSTVALQNVRSFGTEGRRKDGQQIPPSNNVYDYIIFRGSDIKDLQVCEPPPQPAQPQPPNDPAIINAIPENSMGAGPQPSMYGYPGMYQYPYNNPYQMYNSYGYPGAYPPRPHQMGPMPGQPPYPQQPVPGAGQPAVKGQAAPAAPQHSNPSVDGEDREDVEDSQQQAATADVKASGGKAEDEEKPGDSGVESSPAAVTEAARVEPAADGTVYSADQHHEENGGSHAAAKHHEADAGASLLGPYTGSAAPAMGAYGSGERRDRSYNNRSGPRSGGGQRSVNQGGHGQHGGPSMTGGAPMRGGDRRGGAPSQPRTGGGGGIGGGHHGRPQGGPDARSGSGPRSGGGGGSGRYNGAPQKLPEFDFEKANSKFDKEKIKEEVLKGVVHVDTESIPAEGDQAPLPVPAEKAYDKSTSFFDSISCESLDRLKDDSDGGNARSDRRRHERSLNAETFGRAANDRRAHHRGGPRRYGPPGPHQAHGGASAGGSNQPMDNNRPTRGGGFTSARGGYAAAVRGAPGPQKRFVPVGQSSSPVVGH